MNIEFLDLSARAYSRLKIRDINTVEQLRNLSDDDLEAIFGRGALFEEVKERLRNEITNADRIRAMTDEELAKFVPNWSYTNACKCDEKPYVDCNNECDKCVAEWLQQPAEEL